MSVTTTPELKERIEKASEAEELNQSELITKAVEAYLNGSTSEGPGELTFLDTEEEFFTNVSDDKKETLVKGLKSHGITPDNEGRITLSYAKLLELASKLSHMDTEIVMKEGLSYVGQKLITQSLNPSSGQGALGGADNRIIEAIDDLIERVREGTFKPRLKKGSDRYTISESKIAMVAETNVVTVRNCLNRRPELKERIDVTELMNEVY